MWTILTTPKSKTANILIQNAMENRGVENEEEKEDLIRIAPEYLQKLMKTSIQKVCGTSIPRFLFY